jgi:hypothetical protein
MGYDLYVWAFIVFTVSIFSMAVLMIMHGYSKHVQGKPIWGFLEKSAFGLVMLMALGNFVTTQMECGLSPCNG